MVQLPAVLLLMRAPYYSSPCRADSAKCATARLAQSVERKALNLVVVGSSPTVGVCAEYCFSIPSGLSTHALIDYAVTPSLDLVV